MKKFGFGIDRGLLETGTTLPKVGLSRGEIPGARAPQPVSRLVKGLFTLRGRQLP
jgi:hypothetical protein